MRHLLAQIVILAGFICLGIGLSLLVYRLGNSFVQAMPADGTNPVHISLIPNLPTLLPGEEDFLTVYLHPNGRQVSAIELHLTIDPNLLEFSTNHPIATSSALSWILPNCHSGLPPNPDGSCVATSSATVNEALIYLGAHCSESGCSLPPTDTPFSVAKIYVRAKAVSPGITNIQTVPGATASATLIAAFNSDSDVTGIASPATLTITNCRLSHDFIPNNQIDVVDIMQAASRWNTNPSVENYNGQMDLDKNHLINIVDIQQVAAEWSQTCKP